MWQEYITYLARVHHEVTSTWTGSLTLSAVFVIVTVLARFL